MIIKETFRDVKPRPALVHFGELVDSAYIMAEGTVETCRGRGNTIDPAVYLVGEHCGTWALLAQRDDPANPVWYEENVAVTDVHTHILERLMLDVES